MNRVLRPLKVRVAAKRHQGRESRAAISSRLMIVLNRVFGRVQFRGLPHKALPGLRRMTDIFTFKVKDT